ncbi:bifunctional ADP-dependent NAD(P)H-hydrate dehydratase/NAD(P)H-hydrate epimerase [Actinomycetospora chiangmaiensis]|uniref:bifunctional ADP-dependent NAD(P)H-hydrate dehydratase/NAD(P)H-hydrate epimerase n=1 Tax=Actinomycetospora chiangmaiensis TaxID=402650 RepID=UPI00036D26FA|nr:bifunctional ADP-dependent NAD(P)H-hydrate dehydratase/NAD(P)H-hydrate epimerase [Actinomycetospora chiangmaiensis]
MYGVWTPEQVQAAEEPVLARTAEGALMRRAAYGAAQVALRLLTGRTGGTTGRRVVVLVGAGNNGGDGLWAGVDLRRRGVAVMAVLLSPERAHPAGLEALRAAHGRVLTEVEAAVGAIGRADLVLDAIVGTSARGGLRDPAPVLVGAAAAAGVPVLAIDTPSGVDPLTGVVHDEAVTATATVTFGARKPVHVLNRARCGDVTLVDIGLGPELPEPVLRVLGAADVGARWPVPGPADDKYTQGVVGIAAGSATYPGAAVLASGAAALATSGMVRYAGSAADEVRAAWPEVVATDHVEDAGRVQAWAVGPGLGTDDAGAAALRHVLDAGVPVLADADAVTLLGADADLRARAAATTTLVTPHAGEFARLVASFDDPPDPAVDRVDAARRAAAELRVTVLLKGNATVIAAPDGRVLVHPAGSSWLATAGSGDVLSGVAGALLAAGLDPLDAGGCAAFVHARAAELGALGAPVPASHVQAALPDAIRSVREAV